MSVARLSPAPAADRQQRKGRDPAELYGIQMLRGLAAATVVAHHVLEVTWQQGGVAIPNWLVTAGASGVDIFFVISGCIMVHTSFRAGRPATDPGQFLARRATRIYPIYWVCAAVLFALLQIRHGDRISLSDSIFALLLLPGDQPIIPYSWTLNYEVYFYLVFAFALVSRTIFATVGLTVAGMVALALIASLRLTGPWAQFLGDPIPVEFMLGMLLIVALRAVSRTDRRWLFHPLLLFPAYLVICAAPAFVAHTGTVGLPGWPRVIVWGIPSAAIVASFLKVGEPGTRLARMAAVFGNASYSVYLSHVIVMLGYGFLLRSLALPPVAAAMLIPVAFLAASGFGLLVHFFVEIPLMTLSRRLGSGELVVWRRARSR